MPKGPNPGDAEELRDADGYLIKIPYLCRHCDKTFATKHERAGHQRVHKDGALQEREHGSLRGWYQHQDRKEKACSQCKAAWAAYMRRYRQRG